MANGSANRRAADAAMAARMKKNPNRYPDSARRPWLGNGAEYRKMPVETKRSEGSKFDFGFLGGVLCARLGLGSFGIPSELVLR